MEDGLNKLEEMRKSLMRKIRKLDYKNTPLPSGYEGVEEHYRKLRESFLQFDLLMEMFTTYEHGNSLMKNMKKGMQFIIDKASGSPKSKAVDMYGSAAMMGHTLAELRNEESKGKSAAAAEKFKEAFDGASKSKQEFNERVKGIQERIKEMKKETKRIDQCRSEVKNIRYDAELKCQEGNEESKNKARKLKDELKKKADKAQKEMDEFIKNVHMSDAMKDFAQEYKKHLLEVADLMKKME